MVKNNVITNGGIFMRSIIFSTLMLLIVVILSCSCSDSKAKEFETENGSQITENATHKKVEGTDYWIKKPTKLR